MAMVILPLLHYEIFLKLLVSILNWGDIYEAVVAPGGQLPPLWFSFFFFFFFCLSAERSVMAMVILPLLHYENFLKLEKKCVGVFPPPPPPPPSDFFRAGAKFLASRSSSESFCPP